MSAEDEARRMAKASPQREVYEGAEKVPSARSVTVHRGETVPTGEFGSVRYDFTVTDMEVPEGKTALEIIDELNASLVEKCRVEREKAPVRPPEKPQTRPSTAAPSLDVAALARLPWKPSQFGGDYIYADIKGAEGLLAALKEAKGTLRVGQYSYRVSKNFRYVNRYQVQGDGKK